MDRSRAGPPRAGEADVSDDRSPPPLARRSRLWDFAWGLAAFGLLVAPIVVVVMQPKRIERDWSQFESQATQSAYPAYPISLRGAPGFDVRGVGLAAGLLGPAVLAGVLTALRVRWWVGALLGLAFGVVGAWVWSATFSPPTAWLVHLWWLVGGLAGVVLAGCR